MRWQRSRFGEQHREFAILPRDEMADATAEHVSKFLHKKKEGARSG